MSDLEVAIRELIARYLAGDIDATELNDQLPDGWDLDEADDPGATELVLLALGFLAGYQSGDRDEDALRAMLASLITHTVEVAYEVEDDLATVLASRAAETIQAVVGGDSSLEAGFEREASQSPQTEHRTTRALPDLLETH
jgi:hypothetical protein